MSTKPFALCGIAASLVFALLLVVFSWLRPDYSHLSNGVSELGTIGAPYALAWNLLGFILPGLLTLVFAWGLRRDLQPGPGARTIPLLVAISGLGFAGLGFFPAEAGYAPSTLTSLHFSMVAVNFLPFILLAFVFAFQLRTTNYWRAWFIFSLGMGLLALASFFIPRSLPVGLSQRLGIGANFLWLFGIGLALLRKPGRLTQA